MKLIVVCSLFMSMAGLCATQIYKPNILLIADEEDNQSDEKEEQESSDRSVVDDIASAFGTLNDADF